MNLKKLQGLCFQKREKAGVSRAKLGKQLKLSSSTIKKFEEGKPVLTSVIDKITGALGINAEMYFLVPLPDQDVTKVPGTLKSDNAINTDDNE